MRILQSGELQVEGDRALLRRFVLALDDFNPMFNVIEP
jgi:alkyl sulfatase BDS1-like metallo-beta-lactamase superfamily hydrolase